MVVVVKQGDVYNNLKAGRCHVNERQENRLNIVSGRAALILLQGGAALACRSVERFSNRPSPPTFDELSDTQKNKNKE